MACRGLSLMSGGLDSQLAVKVLQRAGAHVEAVCFTSPFFDSSEARFAAAQLGVKLHEIDFLDDIIRLLDNPPHGFGGAMNPCIDCHATMIARAGELMVKLGYDFVATGEVQGQRPMSQNRQALGVVEKTSGLAGRLIRPMSAKLLEPTVPELDGKIDRERLLDISGRSRERQIALAAEFGIEKYPSPAGGCKLTEEGFSRKLIDLKEHEGLGYSRLLVEILTLGRRFRLPGGSSVVLGRDRAENQRLFSIAGEFPEGRLVLPGRPGPTALVPVVRSPEDVRIAEEIVAAYVKGTGPKDREKFKEMQIC